MMRLTSKQIGSGPGAGGDPRPRGAITPTLWGRLSPAHGRGDTPPPTGGGQCVVNSHIINLLTQCLPPIASGITSIT